MPSISTAILTFLALASVSARIPLGVQIARADETPNKTTIVTLSLNEALKLLETQNPELKTKHTAIVQAEATISKAEAAKYPKAFSQSILSPIFEAKGDALRSENDLDHWGIWAQNTLTLIQPVYTFGKISNFEQAAQKAKKAAEAQFDQNKNKKIYDFKALFFGAILAEQWVGFLKTSAKNTTTALTIKSIDQANRYRIEVFQGEIESQLKRAQTLRTLAHKALAYELGFDKNTEVFPEDARLFEIDRPIPNLSVLTQYLITHRPELKAIEFGLSAKQSEKKARHAMLFPNILIGGILNFSYSNVRNGQQSVYAFDAYNRSTGGFGLGLTWDFDLAAVHAEEQRVSADILELEHLQKQAHDGFLLELEQAHAELTLTEENVKIRKGVLRSADRWVVFEAHQHPKLLEALDSLDSGGHSDDHSNTARPSKSRESTNFRNFIEAYLAKAKATHDFWDAIYNHHLAWAKLEQVIGAMPSSSAGGRTPPSSSL